MAEGATKKDVSEEKKVKSDADSLEDLRDKLSDELAPIFEALGSIKTKDEIANFFKTKNSETIKQLLNFILIDSPNESTRLLKKMLDLVDNSMRENPNALSTSIHYGLF